MRNTEWLLQKQEGKEEKGNEEADCGKKVWNVCAGAFVHGYDAKIPGWTQRGTQDERFDAGEMYVS